MNVSKVTVLAFAAALTFTSPAHSSSGSMSMQSYDDCADLKKSADMRLVACNKAITFEGVVGGKKPYWLYINRATAYLDKKQYDLAIQDLNTAITMTPDYQAYTNLAVAFDGQGKYELALAALAKAMELAPEKPLLYRARGEVYLHAGQRERGMQDLDHAIFLAPDDAAGYDSRCEVRTLNNIELDKALEDCNRAVQLAPKNIEMLEGRAILYFHMANYPAAVIDANAMLDIDMRRASALYILGSAKLKMGDAAGAKDIAYANTLDPTVAQTYASYGVMP